MLTIDESWRVLGREDSDYSEMLDRVRSLSMEWVVVYEVSITPCVGRVRVDGFGTREALIERCEEIANDGMEIQCVLHRGESVGFSVDRKIVVNLEGK